jgi:hypothetical protein
MAFVDKSWQDIFSGFRVPEIYGIRDQIKEKSVNKKHELKALVGERYRDLLHTADTITSMEQVVGQEDAMLSQLCGIQHHSQWSTEEANIGRYMETRAANDQAGRFLVKSIIQLVKRELQVWSNYTLIARSLYLGQLLDSNRTIGQLTQQFGAKLESELFQNNYIGAASPLDMFMAYMLVSGKPPGKIHLHLLESRQARIEELAGQQTCSGLVECLKLIGSTLYLGDQTFGKNQLHRLAVQQVDVYSLLDAPEFTGHPELNIKKVRKLLSTAIQTASSIPPSCLEGIEGKGRPTKQSREAFESLDWAFVRKVTNTLSDKLDDIFRPVGELSQLISLYHDVLELLRDAQIMRQLVKTDATWFNGVFQEKWTNRFTEIVRQEVQVLLDSVIGKVISVIDGMDERPQNTNLFGHDSLFLSIPLSEPSLSEVFGCLEDFGNDRVGDIASVAHVCEEWYDTVVGLKNRVSEFAKLRAFVTVDSSDVDVQEDDDEKWRIEAESIISARTNQFTELIDNECALVYGRVLKALEKHAKLDDIRGLAFVIKCVLVVDEVTCRFECEPASQDLLQMTYRELAEQVAAKVTVGDYELTYLRIGWDVVSGTPYPTCPSLTLLSNLSGFVRTITDLLGHDNLIWRYRDGAHEMRSAVVKQLLMRLDEASTKIEHNIGENRTSEISTADENNTAAISNTDQKATIEISTADQNATTEISDDRRDEQQNEATPEDGSQNSKANESNESNGSDGSTGVWETVLLQVYADKTFIRMLFDQPIDQRVGSISKATEDAIRTNMKNMVSRTRLLYSPLV